MIFVGSVKQDTILGFEFIAFIKAAILNYIPLTWLDADVLQISRAILFLQSSLRIKCDAIARRGLDPKGFRKIVVLCILLKYLIFIYLRLHVRFFPPCLSLLNRKLNFWHFYLQVRLHVRLFQSHTMNIIISTFLPKSSF